MSVFRLQSNVPDVYVDDSRDFQLFCRLYDCVFDGVKFDIDSMLNVLDTHSCNNLLLQLLQSKVGFFTSMDITSDELRVIIDAFPVIMKNKGSLTGIKQAINAFLKAKKMKTGAYVNVINESTDPTVEPYVINIGIEADFTNTSLLDILFYYILPTGYIINYSFYTESVQDEEWEFNDKSYKLIFSNPYLTSSVEVAPQIIVATELPAADETTVGKIYAIKSVSSSGNVVYTKYYCDYGVPMDGTQHEYFWKKVENENYRSVSNVGISQVTRYYPLEDDSNPDTYKILDLDPEDLAKYRKSEAVCGYFYNNVFYSDANHTHVITPLCESNKLCYYDLPNRNYYIYTSSFNTVAEGDTARYVLIVHEEDFE